MSELDLALRSLNGSSVRGVRVVQDSLWPLEVEAAYTLRVTECAGAGPMAELILTVKKVTSSPFSYVGNP